MRTWLWLFAAAAACRSPAPPATTTPPPKGEAGAPGISVSPEVERDLRSGMAVAIEIVEVDTDAGGAAASLVAACTVTFDLWDETFLVKLSETAKTKTPDLRAAMTACLGTEPISALTVRVAAGPAPDPLKPAPSPVF